MIKKMTVGVSQTVSSTVWCVDNVPYSDVTYVTVYNGVDAEGLIDNSIVYRLSCVVIVFAYFTWHLEIPTTC